ncbi:enoyl-CoA hydratase/isomerase family protein [Microbacterium sp. NC79]|uniref:enoyl-CoA hydratase/isomerase family protein n=1 Tax=Microbacterium sp. NC79 TaxID=2851009 RepID=UPI001C2BC87F|nr:enoyl-CoA hydratase/isomerase family protein [Microbacterium sp. NC79]MBV0896089.1 enoyl-CoA hydratase/isomerase family protein [Microbacterium sp. NC79]
MTSQPLAPDEPVIRAREEPHGQAQAPLLIEHHADRVVATLNRPEQRNAINKATIDALHDLCAELEQHPKTLIITGAGPHFAGGADIAELRDRRAAEAKQGINLTAFQRIHALPMPVIAALSGYALGGGAELAYAADIRIASPTLKIGNPEPGLGIIAAAGATMRLPEIVGHARAAELLLTGRTLTAEEALAYGLITSITDDPLAEAHAIADRIAQLEPRAVEHTKTVLHTPKQDQPELIGELQAELFDSDAKMRRMTAFLERKTR